MALQELSTNVIDTMVNARKTYRFPLYMLLAACIVVVGVQPARAQHAFEYSARLGANALLYSSDYGHFMPNYNVGMDFSYKYRSPYVVGARVGLGVDVAASTFLSTNYTDHYIIPRELEYDHMDARVDYVLGRYSETQQQIIVSIPLQLGLFFGDFSMFVGVRAGLPVHGCYWQRVTYADLSVYFPDTDVTIGAGQTTSVPATGSQPEDIDFDEVLQVGIEGRTVRGINTLSRSALPLYYVMGTLDLNYSFKIGENTDCGIGIYAEYDPIGYRPAITDNTSLMTWEYTRSIYDNSPIFSREYHSVLESNRADGVSVRTQLDESAEPIVKKFHRASVGIRFSVSLWSVPLDDGKAYRKMQRYKKDCLCDLW